MTEEEEDAPVPLLDPGTPEFFAYYIQNVADAYYEEEYSEQEHFNALPASARHLPGVNNYKIPKDVSNVDSLRLRLHIAPMTAVHFSNNLLLDDLGFSGKIYGPRVGRRYTIRNTRADGYAIIEAERMPKDVVLPVTPTVFFCVPVKELYYSPFVSVSITHETLKSNQKLLPILQGALERLNNWTNLSLSVAYSPNDKKFRFGFPTNRVSVKLRCDSKLANRLGYGLVHAISHGSLPNVAASKEIVIDADGISRALVWDTIMSAVSLENSSSLNTFGFGGPLMATLWPQDPGVMTMKKSSREDEIAVRAPTVQSGQHSVPLKFDVWTFGKNSLVFPLNWPVHSFVAGVLEGRWQRQ